MLVAAHDGTRAAWMPMLIDAETVDSTESAMLPMSRAVFEGLLASAAAGSVIIEDEPGQAVYVKREGNVFRGARERVSVVGERGPRGETGETGAQGPTGPTGPMGYTSNEQGEQGEEGEKGPTGPEGQVGGQGPTGAHGVAVRGDEGARGPTGTRGPTGPAGHTGGAPIGPAGHGGEEGNASVEPGPRGARGPAGPAGPRGVAGPDGEGGAEGPRGDTGPAGRRGTEGTEGARGERGASGATGPAAPSAPLRAMSVADAAWVPSSAWPVVDTARTTGTYDGVTFTASSAAVMNPFAEPTGTLGAARAETAHWRASKDAWLEVDFGRYACVVSYAIGTDRGTSVGLSKWRVVVGTAHETEFAPATPLVTNGAMYEIPLSGPAARVVRLVYTGTGAPCVRFVPRVVGPDARETRLVYSLRDPVVRAGTATDVCVAVAGTCADEGTTVRVFAKRSADAEPVLVGAATAMDAHGNATVACTFASAGTYALSASVTSGTGTITYTWPSATSTVPLTVTN